MYGNLASNLRASILTAAIALGFSALLAGQSDMAFPPATYAARRARLMRQVGNTVVIVPGRYLVGEENLWRQDPNFWYLTGVESPFAILVMTPRRTMLFLPTEYQFAGGQFPTDDPRFRRAPWNRPPRRLTPGKKAAEATGIAETYPLDDFLPQVKEAAASIPRLGVALDGTRLYGFPGTAPPLTYAQQFVRALEDLLPGKEPLDVAPLILRMRLVKDAAEIDVLRQAAKISGAGLVAAMKAARPGMNDRELAGLMEYTWKKLGSPRTAFSPVVASGPAAMTLFTLQQENYNMPDHVMRSGELLFVDYGAAEYKTYATDICRTFPVSGRFSVAQRRYYNIVLEAQEAAIQAVRPGVMMVDVVRAAARVFQRHGLEHFEDINKMGEDHVWGIMPSPTYYLRQKGGLVSYSPHGFGVRDLGHYIGLEPIESRDYSRPLEPGMVFTVEPKLYIPDQTIAIMIEDMILVTPTSRDVLSAATPKNADEIERLMAH